MPASIFPRPSRLPKRCAGIALTLIATMAAPARAADVKTLACVGEHLSVADREALESSIERGMRAGGQGIEAKALKALGAAVDVCRQQFGWSREARTMAGAVFIGQIGAPIAARVLRDQGINADGIEALYQGLPLEVREENADTSDADDLRPMLEIALQKGYFTLAQGALVSRYLGYLNSLDIARVEFARAD